MVKRSATKKCKKAPKNKEKLFRKKKQKPKLLSKKKILCGVRTSWIYFCNQHRNELKQQYPNLAFGDLCKKLAPRWKALNSDEKKQYVDMQKKDQQRYSDGYKSLSKLELSMLRKHRRIAKRKKKLLPKSALSSYMFFVMQNRNRIKDANPNISFQDIGRKLGELWNNLKVQEKQLYINMNIADKQRYEREIQNYKQQLITNRQTV